jgi:ion channel-forming bestrophin family protein
LTPEPTPADIPRLRNTFWREAFAVRGSVTPYVLAEALVFTLMSVGVCFVNDKIPPDLGVEVAPYEVAGAALGLLLVLRTNAGYDRWWEGRKLWGSITNQSRTLVITALAHGPDDPDWRDRVVRWTAAFGHATRSRLRRDRETPELVTLLGPDEAAALNQTRHAPLAVALKVAQILREGSEHFGMDRFAFLVAEQARSSLIEQLGACERILKTPLPRVVSIDVRRFIFLFLATLPFALLKRIGWLTPVVTFLVAYAILSLDQIGVELQNPFDLRNLGHLPLDEITKAIEGDLLALNAPGLDEGRGANGPTAAP